MKQLIFMLNDGVTSVIIVLLSSLEHMHMQFVSFVKHATSCYDTFSNDCMRCN